MMAIDSYVKDFLLQARKKKMVIDKKPEEICWKGYGIFTKYDTK